MAGDNHYGYCRIQGTNQYYIWGECDTSCPDGQYPGIEIRSVEVSDTLYAYQSVIDERDAKLEERKEGFWRGGALGGVGVVGGAAGIGGLCIVSGSFTFGWGCAAVLLALGGDLLLTGLAIDDGIQAGNSITNPQGLDASAEDLFGQLRPNQGS